MVGADGITVGGGGCVVCMWVGGVGGEVARAEGQVGGVC